MASRPPADGAHHGILDLDHVMCRVDDIEAGRRRFERLGFTVTPFSPLGVMAGGNALILFRPRSPGRGNFLELAFMSDPAAAHPLVHGILSPGEGIKTVVHMLADQDEAHAHWRGLGLSVPPPISLRRETVLESGEKVDYRFAVLIPEADQVPFMFNGYTTNTLDNYLLEEFMEHENGARRWAAIVVVEAEDRFDDTVGLYEKLYGVPADSRDGHAILCPGDVAFEIFTPAKLEQYYPAVGLGTGVPRQVGVRIEVADLGRTRKVLAKNGLGFVDLESRLCVPPLEANGVLLEFVQPVPAS